MPKFTQEPMRQRAAAKGIPQEVIDAHKQFIEGLEKGNVGLLEFGKDESLAQSRKALVEAGVQLKKYVKTQKVRGEDNKLKFWQISKKEYDDAKAVAEARGEKLRGKRKPKKASK